MTNRSAGAGRDGKLRELIAQRLQDVASFNGCVGDSRDVTCIDGAPGDPTFWCKFCVQGHAAVLLLAATPTALTYENVWIVSEYEGGGIRGVFVSQGDAEAEIAAICSEHQDLTRSDFVIRIDRVRRSVSAPLASSSETQGESTEKSTTKI